MCWYESHATTHNFHLLNIQNKENNDVVIYIMSLTLFCCWISQPNNLKQEKAVWNHADKTPNQIPRGTSYVVTSSWVATIIAEVLLFIVSGNFNINCYSIRNGHITFIKSCKLKVWVNNYILTPPQAIVSCDTIE